MSLRNSFKYRIVTKKLQKLGCVKLRAGKGSHEIWYNPATDKEFPVVNHGAKNMRMGTLKHMLVLAGIEKQDFLDV